MLIVGSGYRKLGIVLAVVFGLAAAASVTAWFLGAVIGLTLAGRGEGAGLAAILMAFLVSGVAAALTLIGGAVWIYARRQRFLVRDKRVLPLLGTGGVLIILAIGVSVQHFVHVSPAAQSSQKIAEGMLVSPSGPLQGEARAELLARGQEAVPAVISALQSFDKTYLREFENGLNFPVMSQLDILGKLGGPAATMELRTWLNSDYAPDVRAAAAQALGEAGDKESAHAIALLLDEGSYEWRKSRIPLMYALRMLEARDEWEHVRTALQFAPEEEGLGYQISLLDAGIQTLVAFDTPEAWHVIAEVANAGGESRRLRVQQTLENLGRSLPTAETAIGQ